MKVLLLSLETLPLHHVSLQLFFFPISITQEHIGKISKQAKDQYNCLVPVRRQLA